MVYKTANSIWSFADDHWIVIPVAPGWKRNGEAIMGAGLARQASGRFPRLAMTYGRFCQNRACGEDLFVYHEGRLILFPDKPLDPDQPWASWKQDTCLTTIRGSAQMLDDISFVEQYHHAFEPRIAIPGQDLGGEIIRSVRQTLEQILTDDRYVWVEQS